MNDFIKLLTEYTNWTYSMLFLLENNKPLNLELGRDSKRDKVLNLAVKYWLHILQVNK
jgi:hypothetical protein